MILALKRRTEELEHELREAQNDSEIFERENDAVHEKSQDSPL